MAYEVNQSAQRRPGLPPRRSYCAACMEETQTDDADPLCPVCGAVLAAPQPSTPAAAAADTPTAPAASGDLVALSLALGLSERDALNMATELSLQAAGGALGRGASTAALGSLPRIIVADDRCSALQEVALEVRAPGAPKPAFFETQIAAFSALPEAHASPVQAFRFAPLRFATPPEGDRAFDNAEELAGSIAVVARGKATFAAKALRAQAAGALAVVVVNSVGVWPYTMQDSSGEASSAASGGARPLGIPVTMVREADGSSLRSMDRHAGGQLLAALHTRPIELQCPVCQEDLTTGRAVVRLPCRHLFHEKVPLALRHSLPLEPMLGHGCFLPRRMYP